MSKFFEIMDSDHDSFASIRTSQVQAVLERIDEEDRPYTAIITQHGLYQTWELYVNVIEKLNGDHS